MVWRSFSISVFFLVAPMAAEAQCRVEVDLDHDGRLERIELRPHSRRKPEEGSLQVIRQGQEFSLIDAHVVTRECYWMEILGRRGLVVLPHGMQVRFYELPSRRGDPWPSRDIYSFYTASWQGGLLQVDVDGDALPDLICGNYWIKSPSSFELPWRLFAINAYHEHPLSASAQLYWEGKRLLWIESRRPRGRVIWFRPPNDPKQLWLVEPHPLNEQLDCPQLRVVKAQPIISAGKNRCR